MAQHDDGETQTQAQTQTQSQQCSIWATLESQPIENIIWGRLYSKNIKLKSLDLCKEEFKAGRSDICELVFSLEELPKNVLCRISKVHFKIERDITNLNTPVYIHDLARNGTFVNQEKIGYNQKRILLNDDVISLVHPQYKVFVFKDLGANETTDIDKDIITQYYISKRLGSGACGVVRLIYDKYSCQEYAMKQVQKNRLTETTRQRNITDGERVMNEVRIMKSLEHPCVIKMHDIIDKSDSVYMVLELMKGGDLLTRIISNKRLSENISKLFFYQMCHAVKYLHDKGITHRDIKPDNVLLESQNDETLLKVSDFGLSKFVAKDSVMRTLCGTPLYVAPEILSTGGKGCYTKKVDIWSLGVVLFTCLSGTLPFSDDYGSAASEQIKRGIFQFRHPSWKTVSPVAKALITELLTVDPNLRPNVNQILNHPWLKDREIIRKAHLLMKIERNDSGLPDSDDNSENIRRVKTRNCRTQRQEQFLEPPNKRIRIK